MLPLTNGGLAALSHEIYEANERRKRNIARLVQAARASRECWEAVRDDEYLKAAGLLQGAMVSRQIAILNEALEYFGDVS